MLAMGLTSGCGKKDAEKAGGKLGACDRITTESLCVQFDENNFSAAGEEFLQNTCKTMEGTFSIGACPAEGQVGTCPSPEGDKIYYSTGGYPSTPEKGRERCGETWKPAK